MSHVKSWFLPAALSVCLTSCATKAVRPSSAPEPPEVRCEQGATPDVEAWPEDWLRDGPPWAIGVLGLLTEERRLRAIERGCLRELREAGVIR